MPENKIKALNPGIVKIRATIEHGSTYMSSYIKENIVDKYTVENENLSDEDLKEILARIREIKHKIAQ